MFPLILCAAFYLLCVIFLRCAIANAPEAFEDEGGFHYVPGTPMPKRGYVVVSI